MEEEVGFQNLTSSCYLGVKSRKRSKYDFWFCFICLLKKVVQSAKFLQCFKVQNINTVYNLHRAILGFYYFILAKGTVLGSLLC